MSTPSTLINQVAVVTGGGRGIGQSIAQALAAAGATVVVVARTSLQLDATVCMIEKEGGRAIAFTGDVTDIQRVDEIIKTVENQIGPITLFVNNAGDPGPIGPIWEVDAEEWLYCLKANLFAPFICSRAVLPSMISRYAGRIINISSGSGLQAYAYDSAYVTSKTALLRFTENLALETSEFGISVFAIDPGTVRTYMAETVLDSKEMKKWMPWLGQVFDEGKDISASCVANLICTLATGVGDNLSGSFISVFDELGELLIHQKLIKEQNLYKLRLGKLRTL